VKGKKNVPLPQKGGILYITQVALGEDIKSDDPFTLELVHPSGKATTVCSLRRNKKEFQRLDLVLGCEAPSTGPTLRVNGRADGTVHVVGYLEGGPPQEPMLAPAEEEEVTERPAKKAKQAKGDAKKATTTDRDDKKVVQPLAEVMAKASKPEKEATKPGVLQKKTLKGGLIIEVLKEGKGMAAPKGGRVAVQYTGRLANSRGNKFDSSHPKHPLIFKLGAGDVIPGWDSGVQGMKVGEKRALTIPPKLGYGASGMPPVIPKNATLWFMVELVGLT